MFLVICVAEIMYLDKEKKEKEELDENEKAK